MPRGYKSGLVLQFCFPFIGIVTSVQRLFHSRPVHLQPKQTLWGGSGSFLQCVQGPCGLLSGFCHVVGDVPNVFEILQNFWNK